MKAKAPAVASSAAPQWVRAAIRFAAQTTPALSVIDSEAEAAIAEHRRKIASAALRLRASWPLLRSRFFEPLAVHVDSNLRVSAEGACMLVLESALIWYSRRESGPIRRKRSAAKQLVEAEERVLSAARELMWQLESYGASRQGAIEAGVSPKSTLWAEDAGGILDRLGAGHIVWSELCGIGDGALREVIRVSDESTQESPTTIDFLSSVFWSARVLAGTSLLKPKRSGSDPSGEEAVLRLFMESLERTGHNIGCAPDATPLDWLGPDRIAAFLQTIMGSTKYPTRDSVRNARRSVIASRKPSLSGSPGEAHPDI